jgi:hypothetical protein
VEQAGVASFEIVYATCFIAQLALAGIGLPIAVAILLRRSEGPSDPVAIILATWRGRLTIVVPLVLVVFFAPLPATWGLVSAATAASLDATWPVGGWILYVTAVLTCVALLWLVVAIGRVGRTPALSTGRPSPVLLPIVPTPPLGIGFVWDQGVRVIGDQLNTADGLDRKIAPLVAATIATAAIIVGQKDTLVDFTAVLILELAVTAVYLVLALVVRTFQTVPRLAIIAPYAAASSAQLQFAFLGNLLQASAHNDDALSGKTILLNAAIASLFVFLGTGFVAIQRLVH